MARISVADARALGLELKRGNKWRAIAMAICECDMAYATQLKVCPACGKGFAHVRMRFPSKKQMERYFELRMAQTRGEIHGLKQEVTFALIGAHEQPLLNEKGRQITARCDFVYYDRDGRLVIDDAKGRDLALGNIKRSILRAMFPGAVIKIS
jgi:Protein of unknown function (DUF1064)